MWLCSSKLEGWQRGNVAAEWQKWVMNFCLTSDDMIPFHDIIGGGRQLGRRWIDEVDEGTITVFIRFLERVRGWWTFTRHKVTEALAPARAGTTKSAVGGGLLSQTMDLYSGHSYIGGGSCRIANKRGDKHPSQ
jgi:hypothetical protein